MFLGLHAAVRRLRASSRADIDLDRSLSSFVFRVGRYVSDHGVLGAIRSLGSLGIRVHASACGRRSPADWSRYLTQRVPFPATADPGSLVRAFHATAAHLPDAQVLVVPTDDLAAIFINEHGDQLPRQFITVTPRRGVAKLLVDKHRCAQALAECGVPAPPGHVVKGPVGPDDVASIELPVVLKRLARSVDAAGEWSASTLVVRTPKELTAAIEQIDADRAHVLVQPYLEGRDWLYHAYFDHDARPVFAHTAHKIVSDGNGGATALAMTRGNDDVRGLLPRFAARLAYSGPMSADIRETRDGQLFVLDVNPRLGACFRLFTAVGGLDVLRAGHLHGSGRPIPAHNVPDGRRYLVEGAAPPTQFDGVRRQATATSIERAWWDPGDPLPDLFRKVIGLRTRSTALFRGR